MFAAQHRLAALRAAGAATRAHRGVVAAARAARCMSTQQPPSVHVDKAGIITITAAGEGEGEGGAKPTLVFMHGLGDTGNG